MDLSILIVNWNSARYLAGCLASVYRQVAGLEFEVLVIDNASYDGSAALVKRDYPQATFVQSDSNLGFIRGNNLLFRQARGRNILLLNPDTEVVGDALQAMARHLDSLPQAGAIGCLLVDAAGAPQTNSIHAFPTILNQLLDADFLVRRFPRSALWKLGPIYRSGGAPVEVDAVSGACLMVKRSLFEQVGLLSDDYVMYADDLDLCAKLKRAGSKVYFTSQSRVIHYEGRSSASLDRGLSEVWMKDSVHRFLAKFRGRPYAALYRIAMGAAAAVRLALIALARLALIVAPVYHRRFPDDAVAPVYHRRSPDDPVAPVYHRRLLRRERLTSARIKWARTLQWALGSKQWAEQTGKRMGYAAQPLTPSLTPNPQPPTPNPQ